MIQSSPIQIKTGIMERGDNEKSLQAPGGGGGDDAVRAAEYQSGTVEVFTTDIHEKTRGIEHDDAADLFDDEEGLFEYTQAEARRVLLKFDTILLPMVGRKEVTRAEEEVH